MLNIVNGTNVVVTGKIFGPKVISYGGGGIQQVLEKKTPKTMTVVYVHNSTQTRNHKIILGYRQPGDERLDLQQKVVGRKYRFAEAEFKYPIHEESQPTSSVTAVEFSFDVRHGKSHFNQ